MLANKFQNAQCGHTELIMQAEERHLSQKGKKFSGCFYKSLTFLIIRRRLFRKQIQSGPHFFRKLNRKNCLLFTTSSFPLAWVQGQEK